MCLISHGQFSLCTCKRTHCIHRFKVSDVLLTPGMHKTLVIRLSDGSVDQAGFESLPVPAAKLNEVETGGRVWSVMLTVRGEQGGKYDFLSR